MEKTTVSKQDLITKIEENKERHNVIYTEAVKGYWEKATEELQKQVDKARVKDTSGLFLSMPYPTSYEKEYERALTKLAMSIDDVITLNNQEFNQLVMNEWSWKSNFTGTATQYGTGILLSSGIANF